MKAARINQYGPPDVFQMDDIPVPKVGPKDVLVEVHAASVNPIDWKIRSGVQRGIIRYKLPHVLGLDLSGVVSEVGSEVTRFKAGDEVYSSPNFKRNGTYAEFTMVAESELAHKPTNLTHQEAATIPLVGLTAYQCLVTKAKLKADERILILAGSGGVGSFAIQLAKALGANVTATCSARNTELVTSLGADHVIDYTAENVHERPKDFDVVMDNLGGADRNNMRKVLKRGGRMPTIVGGIPQETKRFGPNLGSMVAIAKLVGFIISTRLIRGQRVQYVLRKANSEHLAEITRLIEGEKIRAVVDKVFPLEEVAEAHRYSETGRARGKIVIAVK